MSVSIAMATYNGARFLQEQLDSLANQTLLPAELVVTDDGSTDTTIAILEAFATTAPFAVRIIRNETNIGWKANFMKAASLCTGDYIAFCDQDDVWLPEKLRLCVEAFANPDVLLVYHNATVVSMNLETKSDMGWTAVPTALNKANELDPWRNGYGFTQVYRRWLNIYNVHYKDSADYYDSNQREGHDQWVHFLASAFGGVYYISKPLALYRRHENTVTLQKKLSLREEVLSTNLEGYKHRENAAGLRALILKKIIGELETQYKHNAQVAENNYLNISRYYRLRGEMYVIPTMYNRFVSFLNLILLGAYRPRNKWGVGRKALLRDFVCGVFAFRKISS